jgi:transcriptional regulator with XRE-family HTH domain
MEDVDRLIRQPGQQRPPGPPPTLAKIANRMPTVTGCLARVRDTPTLTVRPVAGVATANRPGARGMATLADVVRQMRTEAGLSVRRLAERSAAAPRTITRVESGRIAPRPSLLNAIANGIDPDARQENLTRLVAAAGASVVPEAQAWQLYRARRLVAGIRAGRVPMPLRYRRAVLLHAAADSMTAAAFALVDLRGALDDVAVIQLSIELLGESARLRCEGGIRVADCVPPRRWRGDPADVSPFAPGLTDFIAVRRWLREWQVRESRARPRSERERGIAATGIREREKVAATGNLADGGHQIPHLTES